jgi:putative hemolysin
LEKPFQIDIDKVISTKSPRLAKWIPSFVMKWIKKTLHQDEMNEFIAGSVGIKDTAFAARTLAYMGAKSSSIGSENIPSTGGAIVASNHPLGGLDGMSLLIEANKVRKDLRFIVNDLLTMLPNFETVFVPVNKLGATAKLSLQKIEQTYSEKRLILIFPAGLCSRKQHGEIKDLEWQKSFVARAIRYGYPIVPSFIKGENSKRFYNLANLRKLLGIKVNIEMFFLPDEMYRQKGKSVSVTFGKPIPASVFDKRHTPHDWAQLVKSFVYELESNPNSDFEEWLNK